MRRHVQRVGDGGRDPRVGVGGREPVQGQLRKVVGMDDVVREARMPGLLGQELLQKGARLDLVRVGLVAGWRRGQQGQAVEDRRFVVLRVPEVDLLVRLLPGAGAGREGHRVRVAVDEIDRAQEILLPIGPRADGPGLVEQPPHARHVPGRLPERVVEAHGDPPVAHHAPGIGFDHLRERLLGLLVPEGVEDGDREVELLLGRGRARDREVDPAELARVARRVDVLVLRRWLRARRIRREHQQAEATDSKSSHPAPPWGRHDSRQGGPPLRRFLTPPLPRSIIGRYPSSRPFPAPPRPQGKQARPSGNPAVEPGSAETYENRPA